MKIIITGITGFIGSNLARKLLDKGHEVYGLTRHVTGRSLQTIEDIKDKVKLMSCNVTEFNSVKECVQKVNPDVIFHLAALSPVRLSFEHPFEFQKINYIGTINIAEVLRELYGPEKVRLIVASTAEVYGIQERVPFKEDLKLEASSPYAVSKVAMDSYMRMLFKVYDFNGVIMRNSNTFGRRHDNSFFTEYLISKMLKKEDIYIGAEDSTRDYMFVDDHVNGYILAMETPEAKGNIFNVAGKQGYSNKEWVTKIAKQLYFPLDKVHFGEYPPGYPVRPLKSDQQYLVLDTAKAEAILGWRQSITLEEGLDKTIGYVKTGLFKEKTKILSDTQLMQIKKILESN